MVFWISELNTVEPSGLIAVSGYHVPTFSTHFIFSRTLETYLTQSKGIMWQLYFVLCVFCISPCTVYKPVLHWCKIRSGPLMKATIVTPLCCMTPLVANVVQEFISALLSHSDEPTSGSSMITSEWPLCPEALQGWHWADSAELRGDTDLQPQWSARARGKQKKSSFFFSLTRDWAGSSTRLG